MTAVLATACGDDEPLTMGAVDEAALTAGVSVTISGVIGTVTVPFVEPVPDVPEGEFEAEMEMAVSLLVASTITDNTANLLEGTLVDGSPTAAGQYAWALSEDHMSATLTFYNATPSGLTLKPGNTYRAELQILSNDYIERIPPGLVFDAVVQ